VELSMVDFVIKCIPTLERDIVFQQRVLVKFNVRKLVCEV
jgi:hypothetical protein